jgi:hypothetical protein
MAKKWTKEDWQGLGLLVSAAVILWIIYKLVMLYLAWLEFLRTISIGIFFTGCAAFAIVVLINYVRSLWNQLVVLPVQTKHSTNGEPAYKRYFFSKNVFSDYRNIVETSAEKSWAIIDYTWGAARFVVPAIFEIESKKVALGVVVPVIFILWPLLLTYFFVIPGSILAGVSLYILFGLLHFIVIGVCITAVYVLAYILRASEGVLSFRLWNGKKGIHSDCGYPLKLVHYECPNCKAVHQRLLPGKYGLKKRQCKCGAWLPTVGFLGRDRLDGYCPNCDKRVYPAQLITKNIRIPLIGGTSVGKRTFLAASLIALHKKARDGFATLAFADSSSRGDYNRSLQDFAHGIIPVKTDDFLINVNAGAGDRLLYFFNLTSKLYKGSYRFARDNYYKNFDGLVFLIDPFSLPKIRERLAGGLETDRGLEPSAEDPSSVYHRMVWTFKQKKYSTKINKPISIVLTKVDAFGAGNEIDNISAVLRSDSKRNLADSESAAVRTWLERYGAGSLVGKIERDFRKYRYFKSSSLGRSPDSNSLSFTPTGVFEPLEFVLNNSGLNFKNGSSANPIAKVRTDTAERYQASITNPGETRVGRLIAGLWGFCIIFCILIGLGLGISNNSKNTERDWRSPSENYLANSEENSRNNNSSPKKSPSPKRKSRSGPPISSNNKAAIDRPENP